MTIAASRIEETPQMDSRVEQRRRITEDDVVRCRELVASIDEIAYRTGAYDQERRWTNPAGALVYDAPRLDPAQITTNYLAMLSEASYFFTGWFLPTAESRLSHGARAFAHMLSDSLSPVFAAKTLAWAANYTRFSGVQAAKCGPPPELIPRLVEHYARSLPSEYCCGRDFDITDFDRVAVLERMAILYRSRILEELRHVAEPVILEIGAGYGALARAIKQVVPNATYVIVDLPHSLAASVCYLATREQAPIVVATGTIVAPAAGAFVFAVNTLARSLELGRVDLAVNTLSFGEMSEPTVDSYARMIRRHLAPTGALFEQNFDCSAVHRENFCDPAAVLSQHFSHHDVISGMYLKGTPRIWRCVAKS